MNQTRSKITAMAKNKIYWTNLQDVAIAAYNSTDDKRRKDRIYNRFIHKPFMTLIEISLHMYPVYTKTHNTTRTALIHECLIFLITSMPKYKPASGRSYSFFTVILKRFIWQLAEKVKNQTFKKKDIVEFIENIGDDVAASDEEQASNIFNNDFFGWCMTHPDTLWKELDHGIGEGALNFMLGRLQSPSEKPTKKQFYADCSAFLGTLGYETTPNTIMKYFKRIKVYAQKFDDVKMSIL